jgi:hypothetical protein
MIDAEDQARGGQGIAAAIEEFVVDADALNGGPIQICAGLFGRVSGATNGGFERMPEIGKGQGGDVEFPARVQDSLSEARTSRGP